MADDFYTVTSTPSSSTDESDTLQVLFCGESQTKPGHRLGPKVYDFYLMHTVLSGSGTFILEGVTYELTAGHTFLIKPEQIICYESDQDNPWRYRWLAFRGNEAKELIDSVFVATGTQVIFLNKPHRSQLLYHRIYQIFRMGNVATSIESRGYLLLLLAIYKQASPVAHHVDMLHDKLRSDGDHLHQRVVHYLSTQYTHPVSIAQMAEALGYNRAYLSRVFKLRTGMSPISFLLRLRMDKAKLLLREKPHLTIEQVSASVGLQDALYFSKQFSKLFQQSPSQYRKDRLRESPKY